MEIGREILKILIIYNQERDSKMYQLVLIVEMIRIFVSRPENVKKKFHRYDSF